MPSGRRIQPLHFAAVDIFFKTCLNVFCLLHSQDEMCKYKHKNDENTMCKAQGQKPGDEIKMSTLAGSNTKHMGITSFVFFG